MNPYALEAKLRIQGEKELGEQCPCSPLVDLHQPSRLDLAFGGAMVGRGSFTEALISVVPPGRQDGFGLTVLAVGGEEAISKAST